MGNKNTRREKLKQLAIHSFPLAIGMVFSCLFWRQSALLLGLYIVMVLLLILSGKDKKIEFLILAYGMAVGFFIETIGTQVGRYQSFASPNFLGIPWWLIIAWGYGFVLMKRVSLTIGTKSPWLYRKHTIIKINNFKL